MSVYIDDYVPVVKYRGLNTKQATSTTSSSANALAIGPNGTTNPTLNVDTSTTSAATGINIKAAAAGSGVAVSVLSSGTNEALKIDAKGSGAIVIGGTSTGGISIGRGGASSIVFAGAKTSIATQNGTPTAAQLLGGYISHASTTGAGTLTIPTGTQLSTAIPGVAVGDNFWVMYVNTGNQTVTITGQTGSTVVGTAAVPTVKNAQMFFINTGTNTWDVVCTVSA